MKSPKNFSFPRKEKFFSHVRISNLPRENFQFLPTKVLSATQKRCGACRSESSKNERYPPIKPQNSSQQELIERFFPKIVAENKKTTIFEA